MRTLLLASGLIFWACTDSTVVPGDSLPELTGSWKYVSLVVSGCDNADFNSQSGCSGTAADCGVLTLTETSWTWVQNQPDGSQLNESGTYTINGNRIYLTSDTAAGLGKYSLSGSAFSYTSTALTFLNASITTGCSYRVTFSRHQQTKTPAS